LLRCSTLGYLTLHLSVGYNFLLAQKIATNVKIGAENLTDRRFSTYSDWKKSLKRGEISTFLPIFPSKYRMCGTELPQLCDCLFLKKAVPLHRQKSKISIHK